MSYLTKQEVRNQARFSASLEGRTYESMFDNINESFAHRFQFDVFLSHSIRDQELVLGVMKYLESMGKKIYVDWIVDRQLSRDYVTPATAEALRNRMKQSSYLLYLATDNSTQSKWMPWEVGYFDSLKPNKIGILPVLDNAYSIFQGQEYLGLYPAISKENLRNFLKNY